MGAADICLSICEAGFMRGSIRGLLVLTAFIAVGVGCYFPLAHYMRESSKPSFAFSQLSREI